MQLTKLPKSRLLWLAAAITAIHLTAQSAPGNDSLLLLLKNATKENFLELSKKPTPAYFLSYRIENSENCVIESEFGRISDENSDKKSVLIVEIRVGDPAFDNLHALGQQFKKQYKSAFPPEYNKALMSKMLKEAAEMAFEDASRELAILKARSALMVDDDIPSHLFVSADPNEYFDHPTTSHFDLDFWKEQARFYTFDLSQFLHKASAKLSHSLKRTYFASSENVFIAENREYTYLDLYVEGFAVDNTPHHISHRYYSDNPMLLPDKHAVNQKMRQMEDLLFQILDAQEISKSYCPVLLSPKVAGVVMHNIIGHASANPEEIKLLQRVSEQNLLSVKSDPSVKHLGNSTLSGSYFYDDEGMLGEPVQVVAKGLPVNMLNGRTQNSVSRHSNGHFRQEAAISNLILQGYNPMSHEEIVAMARTLLRESGDEYALFVADADAACDRGEKLIIHPTVCYKIFKDGRPDMPVRNVAVECEKATFLENIVCVGDSSGSEAICCHVSEERVPTHSCSPAILISKLTCTSRPVNAAAKRHSSAPPSFDTEEDNLPEMLFKAAEKTHNDNLEELYGRTGNAPYYSEFLFTDATTYNVTASEGSVFEAGERTVKSVAPRLLIGDNKFNNENIHPAGITARNIYKLPNELDNQNLNRALSQISRDEFEKTLFQWNLKNMFSDKLSKKRLPDRNTAQRTSERVDVKWDLPDLDAVKNRMAELSASFCNVACISSSNAGLSACVGNAIFWNSEKVSYIKPVSLVKFKLEAEIIDIQGNRIFNKKDIVLEDLKSLFSDRVSGDEHETAADIVAGFIAECGNLAQGYPIEEDYYGPVLLSGDAVGKFLAMSLLQGTDCIISRRNPDFADASFNERFARNNLEDKKDMIVTDRNLSVFANADEDRMYTTDVDGVKIEKIEIIRDGELISLANDCTPTKSEARSNGGRCIAVSADGFVSCKGVESVEVEYKKSTSESSVYRQLLKESAKKGYKYAYCIERFSDDGEIMVMYKIDVRNGKKTAVNGGKLPMLDFHSLRNVAAVTGKSCVSTVCVSTPLPVDNVGATVAVKVKSPGTMLLHTLPITR